MISTAPFGAGAADHDPFSGPAGPAKVTGSTGRGAGPTGVAEPAVAEVDEADGPLVDAAPSDFLSSLPQPAKSVVAVAAPTPRSISRRSASRREMNPSAQSATTSLRTYSSNAIAATLPSAATVSRRASPPPTFPSSARWGGPERSSIEAVRCPAENRRRHVHHDTEICAGATSRHLASWGWA